jgi:hypothetical protein
MHLKAKSKSQLQTIQNSIGTNYSVNITWYGFYYKPPIMEQFL